MALAKDGQLKLDAVPSEGVRSSDCFTKLEQIGEGTYGQVYKARDNETGEIVALKKVRMDNEKEGFPITAIREIKILKKLNDDNIVKLKEIVTQNDSGAQQNKAKGSIYMVFEYMDHDLTGLTDRNDVKFGLPQIKCYLKQLLTGLHFCHSNQVLHRDIKGSNLLINNEGILKLADFGLARNFSSDKDNPAPLTNRVITLWYRPPELLLGATKYGPAIDMWSVGCIFAELLYGKPILPGKNEVDQFQRITELCGSPTEENWPGYLELPWAKQWTDAVPRRPRKLRQTFRNFTPDALELVERLLTLDPEKRGTAAEALDANFFWVQPLPCEPKDLPQYEASHEYQTKKRRQQARQQQDEARHRPAPGQQQGQHPLHAHPPRQGQPPPKQQHPQQQHPPPAAHPPQYAHRPMVPPPVYACPVPATYVAPGQYYTAPPQQYVQPPYAGAVPYGRGAPGYGPPGAVQQMPGVYPPQAYAAGPGVTPFVDVDKNHASMGQQPYTHPSGYRPPMQQGNRNYRQQR